MKNDLSSSPQLLVQRTIAQCADFAIHGQLPPSDLVGRLESNNTLPAHVSLAVIINNDMAPQERAPDLGKPAEAHTDDDRTKAGVAGFRPLKQLDPDLEQSSPPARHGIFDLLPGA